MEKMDLMVAIGFMRTVKVVPLREKGDQNIDDILDKIIQQQGGEVAVINGGKGIGPKEHPSFKEPNYP